MTAEEIAAGMSDAQKRAVLRGGSEYIERFTHARTRSALQDKGVVVGRMYSEQLTPLGQQVRSILEGTSHAD